MPWASASFTRHPRVDTLPRIGDVASGREQRGAAVRRIEDALASAAAEIKAVHCVITGHSTVVDLGRPRGIPGSYRPDDLLNRARS
jgi:hypothetical protein